MSIALDPATKTPGRLPHDGPWWDTAEIALRNRERARRLEERRRAEDAARRAREAAEVERRAACFTCSGTGRRSIDLGNRTITAICTHGSTEETA